ncbi:MAG: hypothetical protein LUQ65_11715 [Candidatus Helarchaeota archaeon]|nr:hypothetical protein [Candidatus Helarchaeota archaeon]
MKRKLIDMLPLLVMSFFTGEMVLFVLFVLNLPYLLIAYIPLFACIVLLIILYFRRKEAD